MLVFPSNPNPGDVFAPGPGFPTWQWDGDKWTRASAAPFTLEGLADVAVTDPVRGQLLTWNDVEDKWVNGGPPAAQALGDLADVMLSTPADGNVLAWNALDGVWRNQLLPPPPVIDLSTLAGPVTINAPTDSDTLSVYGATGRTALVVMNGSGSNGNALATQGAVQFFTDAWVTSFYIDGNGAGFLGGPDPYTRSLAWNTAGNFTFNAPPSLQTLTVNGNGVNTIFQGTNPTLYVRDMGANGAILALETWNTGYGINFTYMNNWPGTAWIRVANNNVMSFGPYGNVTINTPSLGTAPALVVNGSNVGQYAMSILNEAGGNSHGLNLIAGRTNSDYNLRCVDSWQQFTYFVVRGDGQILMPWVSAGSGTPVQIQAGSGLLVQNTSAARFKTDVSSLKRQRARQTVAKLRAINYRYKTEAEHHYGLLAEEVAAIDPQLVIYDDDGAPCSVMYDRVAMLLLPLVQELLGMNEPEARG